jgi:hypothetical protein
MILFRRKKENIFFTKTNQTLEESFSRKQKDIHSERIMN